MKPRIVIFADRARPRVQPVLAGIRQWIDAHADVVAELDADDTPLPPELDVDVAVVVGGDGTIIAQARRVIDRAWPLLGVNVGRLGFLAEFDAESLRTHADHVLSDVVTVHESLVFHVDVCDPDGHVRDSGTAVNDCVITSGPPFRMIAIRLAVDGADGPTLNGDGVIVSTPIGSTAYNLSAGGPIVHPSVDAMTITPLAAHSLAFRPIVVPADGVLALTVMAANPGTSVIRDGQVPARLAEGDHVIIRRHERPARFIRHPEHAYWRTLIDKMRWAQPPGYRDGGES